MNETIEKIAALMAEEESAWKESQIIQTMLIENVSSPEELSKLGWGFGLKQDSGQWNLLTWGKFTSCNFTEESRFESKLKQEFKAICKEAMRRPL
jgi:hypothetical protein